MNSHQLEVDFCVIGGGLSGVCAALSAARNGARVALVQDRSVLGGNASSEVKMHVVGADCHGHRPGARETGLIEEFKLEDAYRNPQGTYSMWDLLFYEKVMENPNITLLLDSDCVGCTTEEVDGRKVITSAHVVRQPSEEEFHIKARFFADCSGDGRLGAEAGADFRMGREAQADFGEDLARPEADHQTLGNSILFTAKKHATPQPFVRPHWVRTFTKDEFKHRGVGGYEYGFWWAEWGGQFDTIKDYAKIRHELLRITLGIWDYVKNSGDHPDSANWVLDWVGAIPGKRESRRFLGDHVLTQHDIQSGRIFDDQVAYGGWWLDLHPPSGVDAVDEPPCIQIHIKDLYSIPLRSLYSRNIANLFFAGRNISATHVAFASTRVMATCSVMGQAIGTAAAVLLTKGGTPLIRESADADTLHLIQQTLLKDDVFLLDIKNEDPLDLARAAVCSASSEGTGTPASAVTTGINRRISSDWGTWAVEGENCWQSEGPLGDLTLRWDQPQTLSELHLTFCSGLQRELSLSPSAWVMEHSVRAAQPEIVKDYDVYLDGQLIQEVRGNYLRKRIHRFEQAVTGRELTVKALATHGGPTTRVFEVRAYA